MRYFIIDKDPLYITSPVITGWRNQFNKIEEIKDRSVFHIESNESLSKASLSAQVSIQKTIFTDIITSPFLLFSNEAFDIINKYERNLKSKTVAIVDLKNNTNAIYHLPINLETIKISENMRDRAIFYCEIEEKTELVINLDLAESLLRRNLKGITLKQVEY